MERVDPLKKKKGIDERETTKRLQKGTKKKKKVVFLVLSRTSQKHPS